MTNQSGIGKGIYSEEDFVNLHKLINEKLKKFCIFINDVQYSPYHPKAKIKKYKIYSNLRKPENGMIENIKSSWNLKLNKSFMIGDKVTDCMAAKKSKLKFYFAKPHFFNQVKSILALLK